MAGMSTGGKMDAGAAAGGGSGGGSSGGGGDMSSMNSGSSSSDSWGMESPPSGSVMNNGNQRNGKWVDAGQWSECDAPCNGGKQFKERFCIPPSGGGKQCKGPTRLERMCNTQA